MKLAIDAMGGDNAPQAIVEGAMAAISDRKDLEIVLVGDEAKIKPLLTNDEGISIIHTEEEIGGDEDPIRAVRRKKNSSLVLAANEVKEKRADACISAGNTGALVVSGLFIVGRMKGIDRPALSPTLPTTNGKGFLLLDAGANVEVNSHNLVQYAIMGSVYAEKVRHIHKPTVGLLNVGTEEEKGNKVAKKAFKQLQKAPINFIGNVEARDLMEGVADVVVTDGFSGNITLKAIEGTAMHVMNILKDTFMSSLKTKVLASMMKKELSGLKKQFDYPEYGGAALFGLAAPVIKSHGSSNSVSIYHTINQACHMIEHDVVTTIGNTVRKLEYLEEV
ncbi:MAG TPA: phosphate acyltransferase PlsX [Pseudogracilibacillus sp.]|nr:phosphate acyltransferase PlsX [Pseudogracilibacillus sp.]